MTRKSLLVILASDSARDRDRNQSQRSSRRRRVFEIISGLGSDQPTRESLERHGRYPRSWPGRFARLY